MATQQRVSQRTTRQEYTVRSKTSSPQTPLSPTRITRLQEKEDMQDLNDRLATYIDRVRHLEGENSRLLLRVTSVEDSNEQEIANIKEMYERELTDARRLLDETAKDKARLQIDVGKYKSQLDELKPRLSSLEKELAAANKRVVALESQVGEKEARIKSLFNERRHLEDEIEKLKKKLADKEKQLAVAKKQVEEETVLRVDLENRLQSLKEELAFKKSVYDAELKESRSKHTSIDLTEVDSKNREEYENKLLLALQEIREQHEYQITMLRQETETLYTSKMNDLKNTVERYRNQATHSTDELREFRTKYDSLESEVNTLRSQNEALIARIKDLEKQLRKEQDNHQQAMVDRDREMADLREVMAEQLKEYEELMNIKLTLDLEIQAYRKLLEGEETRLNLTPSPKRGATPRSAKKVAKRRRVEDTAQTVASASNTGLVAIVEVDTDGKFIKLQNNSDEDQPMGGWHLNQQIDEGAEASYKFTSKFVLKAGKEVTVWASGSGHSHSPPNHLVFKNRANWGTGDKMNTTLVDTSDEVMATRIVTREREVSYEETDSGRIEVGNEDLFYQKGDGNKSCSIM